MIVKDVHQGPTDVINRNNTFLLIRELVTDGREEMKRLFDFIFLLARDAVLFGKLGLPRFLWCRWRCGSAGCTTPTTSSRGLYSGGELNVTCRGRSCNRDTPFFLEKTYYVSQRRDGSCPCLMY